MAVEDKDKIKDLFSSKLGSFESEVPASVWSGLDQILSNQPIQTPDASSSADSSTQSSTQANNAASQVSSVGKIAVVKTIAIAAGIAAAIIVGVVLLPKGELITPSSTEVIAEEKEPVLDNNQEIEQPKTINPFANEPMDIRKAAAAKRDKVTQLTDRIESVENMDHSKIEQQNEEPKNEVDKVEGRTVKQRKESVQLANNNSLFSEESIITHLSSKKISLGVMGNAGLLAHNQSQRGGGNLLFSHDVRSGMFNNLLKNENSQFDLKHKLPLSFGITISKEIMPRLSLETGLVYTYLSSKITSNSRLDIEESQTFSYLGVPVALNYTFYDLGKTKFYVSLGGMVQKDIYGKYTSNMEMNLESEGASGFFNSIFYSEPYYIKKTLKQSNPQFSVRSTLGVSYPLYNKLNLYGTIGGAYYFDADNDYRTIYSDRKFQLDLNLGIKFDF